MNSIKILEAEHQNVLRLCKIIRQMLVRILKDKQSLNVEDMNQVIDTIQNYTDAHHHGKEEEILFKYMLEELGEPGEKIVRNGMLVEHELARYHVRSWKEHLDLYGGDHDPNRLVDIFGHAFAYADLLEAHVAREDGVVYPFASRALSDDKKKIIEAESRVFEAQAEEKGLQSHYAKLIDKLEEKYVLEKE